MRYRKLGRSGLLVSELCLGTNMFGGADLKFWKRLGGLDQKAVNAVVSAAVEGGVNFIDTADGYTDGQSEMHLGQALADLALDRSELVLCTKAGMATGKGPNGAGASRANILRAVEGSLKRLGTDYIDLYMMHFLDPVTPIEESLRAFDDLIAAGKVRYIGCSNLAAWELMKTLGISERERLARFEVIQCGWSLANREIERDMVPLARSEGVGITVFGALLGGVLTGKYARDGSSDDPGRFSGRIPDTLDAERIFDTVDVMREIAAAHEVTPAEIALAFLLREPATTSVLFGSTKPEQVKANLRASGLELSDEEYRRLDEIGAPPPSHHFSALANTRSFRRELL